MVVLLAKIQPDWSCRKDVLLWAFFVFFYCQNLCQSCAIILWYWLINFIHWQSEHSRLYTLSFCFISRKKIFFSIALLWHISMDIANGWIWFRKNLMLYVRSFFKFWRMDLMNDALLIIYKFFSEYLIIIIIVSIRSLFVLICRNDFIECTIHKIVHTKNGKCEMSCESKRRFNSCVSIFKWIH